MATSELLQHLRNRFSVDLRDVLSGVVCTSGLPEQAPPIDIELHRTGPC